MLNAVSLTYWNINSITVTVAADIIFSTPSASCQLSYNNLQGEEECISRGQYKWHRDCVQPSWGLKGHFWQVIGQDSFRPKGRGFQCCNLTSWLERVQLCGYWFLPLRVKTVVAWGVYVHPTVVSGTWIFAWFLHFRNLSKHMHACTHTHKNVPIPYNLQFPLKSIVCLWSVCLFLTINTQVFQVFIALQSPT